MTRITLNLQNFSQKDALIQIFEKYTNYFEYTPDGIFRRVAPPVCSCGTRMNHNGYNTIVKKDLGSVKIGSMNVLSAKNL